MRICTIITFCGHSDFSNSKKYEESLIKLLEEICENNQVDFYLGCYGKFDYFAYRCVKNIKGKYPKTKLYFITPYLYKNYSKLEFARNKFDEIIYPALENISPRLAILKRNEWMVEKADIIIAYVKRNFGGARTMLEFAKKGKKQ